MKTNTSMGFAVFGSGVRNKAEIEWKNHALRKNLGQTELPFLFVELEFVSGTLRRFDDYLRSAVDSDS